MYVPILTQVYLYAQDEKKLDMGDLRARLQTMRGYENGAKEEVKRHPPAAVHLYCKTVKKGPRNVPKDKCVKTLTERIIDSQKVSAKGHDHHHVEVTTASTLECDKDRDETADALYMTAYISKPLKVGSKVGQANHIQLIDRDKEWTIKTTMGLSSAESGEGEDDDVREAKK